VLIAFAPGVENTHRRSAIPDVAAVPHDACRVPLLKADERRLFEPGHDNSGDRVLCCEDPEGVRPFFPCELQSEIGIDNRSSEDGLDRRREEVGALEKERPLLREEELES